MPGIYDEKGRAWAYPVEELAAATYKLKTNFGKAAPLWSTRRLNAGVFSHNWNSHLLTTSDNGSRRLFLPRRLGFVNKQCVHLQSYEYHVPFFSMNAACKTASPEDFWSGTLFPMGEEIYCTVYAVQPADFETRFLCHVDGERTPPAGPNFLNEFVDWFNERFDRFEPQFVDACNELHEIVSTLQALEELRNECE